MQKTFKSLIASLLLIAGLIAGAGIQAQVKKANSIPADQQKPLSYFNV